MYFIRLTKHHQRLRKMSRFRLFRGRGMGRMRYAPTTGYMQSFKILMQFPNRVCAILQKMIPSLSPSGPSVGRIRYAPTTGYVWHFKKQSCFRPLRGRLWGVFDTPLRPGMCGPSKNYLVFVPFGAACGAYVIRPYNWIRVPLRNTDTISRPEGRGRLGGGAVGATACGGGGRE